MTHIDAQNTDRSQFDGLSDKWRFRFEFFAAHGVPGMAKTDPAFVAALKALPFGKRMQITFNWCGVLLGAFYLLYLGLWRKAVLIAGVGLTLMAVTIALDLPLFVDQAVSIALWLIVATRVNVWHYRDTVSGRHDWSL